MRRDKSSGKVISDRRKASRKPANERRKSPRTVCDLGCRILRGRKGIRARILDVSDSGLSLVSPVELNQGDDLQIEIDVPKYGVSHIQAFVWHIRSIKKTSANKRVWTAGMVLVKSDDTYARLLAPADQKVPVEDDPKDESDKPQSSRRPVQTRPVQTKREQHSRIVTRATEEKARGPAVADEIQVFRVRVQLKGGQRSRLLTLKAATEEEARKLALADLDDSWSIIDVRNASAAT